MFYNWPHLQRNQVLLLQQETKVHGVHPLDQLLLKSSKQKTFLMKQVERKSCSGEFNNYIQYMYNIHLHEIFTDSITITYFSFNNLKLYSLHLSLQSPLYLLDIICVFGLYIVTSNIIIKYFYFTGKSQETDRAGIVAVTAVTSEARRVAEAFSPDKR